MIDDDDEVIDFHSFNEKTIGDLPLPNITEIFSQLRSAKYFSVFDHTSGFQQIPIHESDAQKQLSPLRTSINSIECHSN